MNAKASICPVNRGVLSLKRVGRVRHTLTLDPGVFTKSNLLEIANARFYKRFSIFLKKISDNGNF
jgi:hypothetical protein